MQLNIMPSDGIQLNSELEKNMEFKFAQLEKIYKPITGFEVTMKKLDNYSDNNCMIEGRVLLSKSSFFCREKANSFEIAFDQVIDNLTQQLKRQTEQRTEIW